MIKRNIKLYSSIIRPDPAPLINTGPKITETAGYISIKQQVENILRAGERLTEYRREHYDYGNEKEDDGETIDPLRNPNFDLADASEILSEQTEKIENAKSKTKLPEEKVSKVPGEDNIDPPVDPEANSDD